MSSLGQSAKRLLKIYQPPSEIIRWCYKWQPIRLCEISFLQCELTMYRCKKDGGTSKAPLGASEWLVNF